jgi:glycosyltransferase involved in cell wall biosynthesis
VAVLIPCFNEAVSIAKVVADFQHHLPAAKIYVYDNNSLDGTATIAQSSGAIVRFEKRQGKGSVVRRMFADIEADIYLMVDGDDTYDVPSASKLIDLLLLGPFDLVNSARETDIREAYRRGHRLGNKVLTGLVCNIFGTHLKDMLSGYKVFSRRYVKSFPAMSSGFEIETELVVHALEMRMPTAEISTPYKDRAEGSTSKLRTFRDGFRILRLIAQLVKEERPFQFFGLVAAVGASIAIALGTSVVLEFVETGLVPRLPTAVFATGAMLSAFLFFFRVDFGHGNEGPSRNETPRLSCLPGPRGGGRVGLSNSQPPCDSSRAYHFARLKAGILFVFR